MTSYNLSRAFWDFAFENPSKIKPIHCSIFFFSIEHCNRLGWKKEFGLPTSMVIEAIGVKSYSVYKKAFDELVSWGFFIVVQYSKNQYSSNIIALKDYCKAHDKALDKALIKHGTKQQESTEQSIDSIDKQVNKETKKQINKYSENAKILNEFSQPFFDLKYINEKSLEMFDKLLKKYSEDQIKAAITNAKADKFWNTNFLSPMKLVAKDKTGVSYIDVFLNLKPQPSQQVCQKRRMVHYEMNGFFYTHYEMAYNQNLQSLGAEKVKFLNYVEDAN